VKHGKGTSPQLPARDAGTAWAEGCREKGFADCWTNGHAYAFMHALI
jgi:hypothetical protein